MLAETCVDAFLRILERDMPESLEIKAYYDSEQAIQSVPAYPCITVICPNYDVVQFFDDYVDARFHVIIGCMVLDQVPSSLRHKLYQMTETIFTTIVHAVNADDFEYTIERQQFRADFSPIFTQPQEQFIADARIEFMVRAKKAEEF